MEQQARGGSSVNLLSRVSTGNVPVETIYGTIVSDRVQIPKPMQPDFKIRVQNDIVAKSTKLDGESRKGRLQKKMLVRVYSS